MVVENGDRTYLEPFLFLSGGFVDGDSIGVLLLALFAARHVDERVDGEVVVWHKAL